MNFEPINKFWQQPTKAELEASNAHLKMALVAVVVVAVVGWVCFFLTVISK